MGRFVGNPEQMNLIGSKILEDADSFKTNYEKIFKTVDEMLMSDFISPDARALGASIKSNADTLQNMYKVMNDYGIYCKNSANKIIRNQESNIDGMRGAF